MKVEEPGNLHRTLLEICLATATDSEKDIGFQINLLGTNYCALAMQRPVDCPYCDKDLDKNNMRRCMNPYFDIVKCPQYGG